jgi:hypothetical protein
MTAIASQRGRDVGHRIHTGGSSTVMTALAGAVHLRMIYDSNRLPGTVIMTGLTQIRGVNVRGTHARGTSAIVTACTGFTRQTVIKHRHSPGVSHMTAIASQCSGDMHYRILTGGSSTVMTVLTGAIHLSVIHGNNWLPGRGVMTGIALVTGIDVYGRIFAGGTHPIMTGKTRLGQACMIKMDVGPVGCGMTGIAAIRRRDMRGILTGCRGAIMTAFTSPNHFCMIHGGDRFPDIGGMTGSTVIRGVNVRGTLASRYRVVVTGHAGAIHLRVIDTCYRFPNVCAMASLTVIGSIDVRKRFSSRCSIIVTTDTGAIHLCVINRRNRFP